MENVNCLARQLGRAEPTTIAFLGTSITWGRGSRGAACTEPGVDGCAMPSQARKLLRQRYPTAEINIATHGYPGASPMYLAACIERLLPTRAHAYVLEFADNLCDKEECMRESADAVASIVAALRQRSPSAALLLLVPFPQSCARLLRAPATVALGCERCLRARFSLAGHLEQLGRREGLPTLSARQALATSLRAACSSSSRGGGGAVSRSGASSSRREHASMNASGWVDAWMADSVHPSVRGHALLGKLVADVLSDAGTGNPTGCRVDLAMTTVPGAWVDTAPPLSWGAGPLARSVHGTFADETNAVCAVGDELTRHVRSAAGFTYVDERNAANASKPGLVATRAGATLELCFAPPAAAVVRGERFEWRLAYLQSHAGGMGTARGECVRGCTCRAATWDAHLSTRRVSQPALGTLNVRVVTGGRDAPRAASPFSPPSACSCVVRLTVLDETRSGRHKFKLVALMSGFYAYQPKFVLESL